MKIKSKNGVYIDDISDWGVNLCASNHPGKLVQKEVLLEEGYYKQIGEPMEYLENGMPKIEYVEGNEVKWMIVELEEMGIPLRSIN